MGIKTLCIAITLVFSFKLVFAQVYSELWGQTGEKWSYDSRLPDFSYAGYHTGEVALPDVAIVANVMDFGAVGDGEADDTQAFLDAIAGTENGALWVPAGKYKITDILEIKKSNLVIRGEGMSKSTLVFPIPLNDIKPNWGSTTGGRPTSNYSWSGGFIWVEGSFRSTHLADVTQPATRGDRSLVLSKTENLNPGQRVEIRMEDLDDNSLASHLYSDDPGNMTKLVGRTHASLVVTILEIQGNTIYFDRPLRFDIELRWTPEIIRYDPTVTEVGIEDLAFEFPAIPYEGHFTELGNNPLTFRNVANSWARNLLFKNPDSGPMLNSRFCTFVNLHYQSQREPDNSGNRGHHGVYLQNDDNLFTGFDFGTTFIHDITVSHNAGNVISNGKGMNLALDHHKRAPYANLFTHLDAGAGTRLWKSGGGADLGRHSAGHETFWNITALNSIPAPGDFGPWSLNRVGLTSDEPSETDLEGIWQENIPPEQLMPQNLHEAQLLKRLEYRKNKCPFDHSSTDHPRVRKGPAPGFPAADLLAPGSAFPLGKGEVLKEGL